MRVDWGVELPRELRAALSTYVDRYYDLLPSWCHTLEIRLETDEDAVDISMTANYKYRSAQMCATTVFLTRALEDREQTVIHEFVHVLNAPMIEFEDSLIAILEEKAPDAKAMLEKLQEAGMEAATEDCAQLLWRLTEDRRV